MLFRLNDSLCIAMARALLFRLVSVVMGIIIQTKRTGVYSKQLKGNGGHVMKKIIVLVLVVLGLLAIIPAMEVDSSTQVFSRSGFAEGGS